MNIGNLRQKLGALVKDIEKMDSQEKLNTLEDFFNFELGLQERVRYWGKKDIDAIKDRAIGIMQEVSTGMKVSGQKVYQDNEFLRYFAIAQATLDYARRRQLLPYTVKVDSGGTQTESCTHSDVGFSPDEYFYRCTDCGDEVVPILWKSAKNSK